MRRSSHRRLLIASSAALWLALTAGSGCGDETENHPTTTGTATGTATGGGGMAAGGGGAAAGGGGVGGVAGGGGGVAGGGGGVAGGGGGVAGGGVGGTAGGSGGVGGAADGGGGVGGAAEGGGGVGGAAGGGGGVGGAAGGSGGMAAGGSGGMAAGGGGAGGGGVGGAGGGGSTTMNLKIVEVMYNPQSTEPEWEWVELYNAGSTAVDLSGWVFDDDDNAPLTGANIASGTIAANGVAVLFNADAVSETDFDAGWPNWPDLIAVTGWPQLNNTGDRISLWQSFTDYDGDTAHANAQVTVTFEEDTNGWPSANGRSSIYLTNLALDPTVGSNWALSQNGVADAYTSSNAGGNSGQDIGSPGLKPN